MKKSNSTSGFALALTLVLMVLILIVVVAYLVSTRIERSTSSVYANRLRAKIQADSGLAAAIHLLKDNTRYGNYITAMPAPSPSPASIYTEIYRPTDSTSRTTISNQYVQLANAGGEPLVSLATASTSPGPDPRPTPNVVYSSPTPSPLPSFGLPTPTMTSTNSYDFNQVVTIGSTTGRLVQPSPSPAPPPAYGQWVNVRDSNSQLIGRYAFYIEDESMKVNVNYAGNNVGGSNMRVNDLSPLPASTPSSQIQEIDPSAILPTSASRAAADTSLTNLGNAGSRLSSRLTLGLLTNWNTSFPDYAHLATVLSRDDDSTARGWQRMDLNSVVASNDAKTAAGKIANWIRDAWTGPTLGTLQDSQLFGNDRLRQQIAANIVDYIDTDNNPTDLKDILPDGYTDPAYKIPVIGIEKVPYLGAIFISFEASNRSGNTATVKMKMRFTFFNLYEPSLKLTDFVKRIEVQGVPVVVKKGATVFDHYSQVFSIQTTDLIPLGSSGFTIPPGTNGSVLNEAGSGARSFDTAWLVPGETVTFSTLSSNPIFQSGQVQIRIFGQDSSGTEIRLDVTAAATTDTPSTGYRRSGSTSVGDFLLDATPGPLDVSAIYLMERVVSPNTEDFGDPRYRSALLNDRWRRINLTDNQALTDRLNVMNSSASDYPNPRTSGVDWCDYYANRPLAFLRNAPMLNIGELGNISFADYPWRTGYLQYPERPANTTDPTLVSEITTRRSQSVDYVLLDLFRTRTTQPRLGAININSQAGNSTQGSGTALFAALPIDAELLSAGATTTIVNTVSNRRTTTQTDNNPIRPFFQNGELASAISRQINASDGTTVSSRSKVTTTVLSNTSDYQRDMQVEQAFRDISNAITTRGNVFRILYVGQSLKSGITQAEYLGEAFVERQSSFSAPGASPSPTPTPNPDALATADSNYRIIANRVITE